MEILQKFLAFSEYMNFTEKLKDSYLWKTTFYLCQIEVLEYVFLQKDLKTDLAKIDCHKNTKMALELEFEFAFGSYDDRTNLAFLGTRYQPKVKFMFFKSTKNYEIYTVNLSFTW